MTHGAKISSHSLFESKCGEDLRILHILDQLQCELYGSIVGYYSSVKHTVRSEMLKITVFEKQKIQTKTSKIPLQEREKFKTLFNDERSQGQSLPRYSHSIVLGGLDETS